MIAGILEDTTGAPRGRARISDVVGGVSDGPPRDRPPPTARFSIDRLPARPVAASTSSIRRIRPTTWRSSPRRTTSPGHGSRLALGGGVEGAPCLDAASGAPIPRRDPRRVRPGQRARRGVDRQGPGRWKLGPLKPGHWKIAIKLPGYPRAGPRARTSRSRTRRGGTSVRDIRIEARRRGALIGRHGARCPAVSAPPLHT